MSGSDVQYYFEATVLDGVGDPVEGATLTVEDDSGAVDVVWGDSGNTTDAQGKVGGLVYNGSYTAIAEYEGSGGTTQTGSATFIIDGGDVQFDIVLGEGSTGGGDEYGGSTKRFGGASGGTDTNGVFNFDAPNGEYRVIVDEPADGPIPTFELEVVDNDDGPVAGATITAETADGAPVEGFSATTGTDGGAVIDLEAGDYRFIADSGGLTGTLEYTVDNYNKRGYIYLGQDNVAKYSGATTGKVTVDGSDLDIQAELGGKVTTGGGGEADVETALTVDTLTATNVTASSVTLNGELTGLTGAKEATVSFEWIKRGGSFPDETVGQTLTAVGTFSAELTGLASDTQYDFRAVAEADGKSDTGSEMTFTTSL